MRRLLEHRKRHQAPALWRRTRKPFGAQSSLQQILSILHSKKLISARTWKMHGPSLMTTAASGELRSVPASPGLESPLLEADVVASQQITYAFANGKTVASSFSKPNQFASFVIITRVDFYSNLGEREQNRLNCINASGDASLHARGPTDFVFADPSLVVPLRQVEPNFHVKFCIGMVNLKTADGHQHF
jgi:hypothetical protein